MRNILSLLHQPTVTAEKLTSQIKRRAMICFEMKAARVTVLPSARNYPPLCCLYKFEFQPPHTSHARFTETHTKERKQSIILIVETVCSFRLKAGFHMIADRNKVCDRLRSCDRDRRRSQKIEPCSI